MGVVSEVALYPFLVLQVVVAYLICFEVQLMVVILFQVQDITSS
jgi:hypothetical protein